MDRMILMLYIVFGSLAFIMLVLTSNNTISLHESLWECSMEDIRTHECTEYSRVDK